MEIDIVVPVWNRPVETRSCLVSLVEHSPGARFIFIDNACDRETERLLHEVADALDHRALLVRTNSNIGLVPAINLGLSRAEAPFLGLVRNICRVGKGWLPPILEFARSHPDAGVLMPLLLPEGASEKRMPANCSPAMEASEASIDAMVLRRELYERAGGLDEGLDAAVWCARDYARRAHREGFLAFTIGTSVVFRSPEATLGSPSKREEVVRRSAMLYRERWEDDSSFCIHFPGEVTQESIQQRLDLFLAAARQGHRVTLLVSAKLSRRLSEMGMSRVHENIRMEQLPRLFTAGGAQKLLAAVRQAYSRTTAVTGVDGIPFPGEPEAIPFSRFEELVRAAEAERFRPLTARDDVQQVTETGGFA
ncbi:glycosyltransferase family 2 protein [Geobacter sp. DSM 9736]|uniref:glycosyltransferase family 2 protein n=1 Tax=Geobacter sp. DSM 9736 TaxID=1277350 RepID=UPI000B5087B1|nr:glycosyltransferase [Geobacter sp. DSM 9736]SNB44688.1 Glycosyltransferase, GT2 family [Geobacter sp. DSM 9736]